MTRTQTVVALIEQKGPMRLRELKAEMGCTNSIACRAVYRLLKMRVIAPRNIGRLRHYVMIGSI